MLPVRTSYLVLSRCPSPKETASPDFCTNDDMIDEDLPEDSDSCDWEVPLEDGLGLEANTYVITGKRQKVLKTFIET